MTIQEKKERLLAAEAELRAAMEDLLKGSFIVSLMVDWGTKYPEHPLVAIPKPENSNGWDGCEDVVFIAESREALEEYYILFLEANPGIEDSIDWDIYQE